MDQRTNSPFLGWVLPRLSEAATRGLLWPAIAAGLWSSGDRLARRAAWRGLGSAGALTAVSAAVNRDRAASSLSSGGAASAAAFATGVAVEVPALTVPVSMLAASVAAAAVLTGTHYPSDVIAGLAVGGATGWLTLRWWPRRPALPAAVRPPRRAPASPAGEGVVLVANTAAGTTSPRLVQQLRSELPEARIIESESGADLPTLLHGAARGARILGVAGGDGTVSLASAVALEASLPLLVIPAGRANEFAADLGIRYPEQAIAALRAGDAVLVDAGSAGKRPFVNTASTGVYLNLVQARQQLEPAVGWRLGAIAALVKALRRARPHELVLNGKRRRLWLYFAGNCRYEPDGLAPTYRPDLSDGYFDFRVVEAKLLARCRLIAAVITGTLGRSRVYHAWHAPYADVSSPGGAPIWLSVDGEAPTAGPGFRLRKRPHRLLVYRAAD